MDNLYIHELSFDLAAEDDETKNKVVQDGCLTSDLKDVGLGLCQSLGLLQP